MKLFYLSILLTIVIGCLVTPHINFTSPTTNHFGLYKFNASTDTASSLQLTSVYPFTKGNGIVVAEIDTGVDPMFESHIFHNTHETPDGKDDDGNGYIDDLRGWNVLNDTNNTFDDSYSYHGTEVASMILSIAPDATILPIKYIGSDNTIADYSQLLKLNDALDYIALFKVDIIVMAFNFNVATPSTTLTRLQNLQGNGTIILVAAGNCDPSSSNCGYIQSPARNSFVYAIGSIDAGNYHSDFSAEGPELDFVLYGQDVTVFSPDYPSGTTESGTSFSVAQAGGLFALYKALFLQKFPMFNLTKCIESIIMTAKGLGNPNLYGHGIPQIYTAFKAFDDTDFPQLLSYSYTILSQNSLVLNTLFSDESGLSACTYQQANGYNSSYRLNQTCSGIVFLPLASDSSNQIHYGMYLTNLSYIMQIKMYVVDMNYHQSSFSIQLSVTFTSSSSTTSSSSGSISSYSIVTSTQNTSSTPDSTVGIIQVSTVTKTTSGLDIVFALFGLCIFSTRIFIKRKKNN